MSWSPSRFKRVWAWARVEAHYHLCLTYDYESYNTGVKHNEDELRESLRHLAGRGMRSVILIGGGEPTVYPRFVDMVRYLKQDLGQQVAVVSNGGRNDRILEAAGPIFADKGFGQT